MIRWQGRSEMVSIGHNDTRVAQRNRTEVGFCVPGVWSHTRTETHYTVSGLRRMEGGLEFAQSGSGLAWRFYSNTQLQARRPKGINDTPLLIISPEAAAAVKSSAVAEGVKTGLVNSSTGALIGLGAWCFGGPPGAALFYMLTGAGAVGATTGLLQASAVSMSNDDRRFIEDCNAFLHQVQDFGLFVETVVMLERLAARAEGEMQRKAAHDIAAYLLMYFPGRGPPQVSERLHRLAPEVDLRKCLGVEATRLPYGMWDNQPTPGQRRNSV